MLEAGYYAPLVTLTGLDGEKVEAGGKSDEYVLLAFFKVTCPTCQLTFPFLQRFAEKASVRVIGISQDDAPATRRFNDTYGVKFETLLDPREEGYAASNRYLIRHVPSLFLIEPNGDISWTSYGFVMRDLESLGKRFGVEIFTLADAVPTFKPG